MEKIKSKTVQSAAGYFSCAEKALWGISGAAILASFLVFDRGNLLTLCASLVGVTSLLFNAKGNPFGQLLMVVFSLLYGMISYTFSYYGEMITYLGMTMPMAVAALVSWLKHPYDANHTSGPAQVRVNRLGRLETAVLCPLTAAVTAAFYFILRSLGTANLLPSTLSVATSFWAAYLTLRRSAMYAVAYAANDGVLVALWLLASREETRYLSVVVCFAAFFVNDLYGFVSWRRMGRRQREKAQRV